MREVDDVYKSSSVKRKELKVGEESERLGKRDCLYARRGEGSPELRSNLTYGPGRIGSDGANEITESR